IDAAQRVVAVEVDPILAAELPATLADRAAALADRLEVITSDALSLRAVPGPQPTVLVANLPYNVAVPVVLHLLDELPSIERALVMVQAEVADRMSAAPGSKTYGIPSAKLAWYGTARRAGAVSRTVFWPAPNVDSALVAFTRWPAGSNPGKADGLPGATREEVFAVINAAFAQRRKTLRSALASWAGSPGSAERVLREAGVEPSLRGEAIGIEQYIRIVLAARKARTIIES
ncbi:MAG: ribosomal RNA small subunit methyltransferase A, partial [Streptosporangiaceae bacterium]